MFVSVCMPVRNGSREIERTLRHLLVHSSYPVDRMEVLVGNHGSTDDTAQIIARLQSRFPALEQVEVPYMGPNRASVRNALIRRARGEILIFLDHDILVSPDFIARHTAAHRQFPGALVAGLTFGKAILAQDFGPLLAQLDLDDISRSESTLRAHREFADIRTRPNMLPAGAPFVDVSQELVPFRFFWTCNLSARREDIDECGRFDEAYDGWGLEDDDFAHQFLDCGKRLIFSHDAWAFHIPHASDGLGNLLSWRRNFEYFFRKFASREIELYSLYGSEVLAGVRRLSALLAGLQQVDVRMVEAVGQHLGSARGRRLCHFVKDPEVAVQLGLTDALDPFGSPMLRDASRKGVRFWPYVGVKTTFADAEIDETVVLTDVLMLLDRPLLTLVLTETARISKRVVFCSSSRALDPGRAFARETLRSVAATLALRQVAWVEGSSAG